MTTGSVLTGAATVMLSTIAETDQMKKLVVKDLVFKHRNINTKDSYNGSSKFVQIRVGLYLISIT